jgi:hypothetical protein
MRLFLIGVLFIFSASLQAQKITKDSLLNKMSLEVCKEIEKKDFSNSDPSNLQYEIGILMVPAITGNLEAIEAIYGSAITDKKSMEKMSIDLAMKLMTNCPKFTKVAMELGGMGQKTPSDEKIKYTPPKFVTNENTISGTFLSLNAGDFTSVSIKGKDGKTERYYWFDYFENADFFASNTKKFIQKKVTVQYETKEVYEVAKKEYKTIKVITKLELE